jgi:hypothetical protein
MIHIVRGVYGYLDKDGIVRPKTDADAPFELTPEQEERLVRLGVAEYVGKVNAAPVAEAESGVSTEEAPTDGISLADLSVKELREIGKEYGLTFKVGISKAEMVAAIEEAEANVDVEEEDGEDTPTFEPSEAVQ